MNYSDILICRSFWPCVRLGGKEINRFYGFEQLLVSAKVKAEIKHSGVIFLER